MTELEQNIGSNGSHETKIQDFVEVKLFSPSELEKDGAKFTEIAKIPITELACCPEGAKNGHGRIPRDRLFILKDSGSKSA